MARFMLTLSEKSKNYKITYKNKSNEKIIIICISVIGFSCCIWTEKRA
ncbi:hypothetical protein CCYN49044_20143 [Capnocytophaga cynodegmi]|nr:hypothetical protein CCYN49044_20143 [Capnocytophaga cynodegmi]